MPFSLQLDLDPVATSAIARLSDPLEGMPGLTTQRQTGAMPHLTLAVYDELPEVDPRAMLRAVAALIEPITLLPACIGVFPGAHSVLFVTPTMTEKLLSLHQRASGCMQSFGAIGGTMYRPGLWVPHITLALDIEPAVLPFALEAIRSQWRTDSLRCDQLRLVRFHPVQTVAQAPLA